MLLETIRKKTNHHIEIQNCVIIVCEIVSIDDPRKLNENSQLT
jgi:hypothetical protein